MEICSRHDIAYETLTCPACDIEDDLSDANSSIIDLQDEINSLNEQIDKLMKGE